MISRRSFLIGLGAAATTMGAAKLEVARSLATELSKLWIARDFDWAAICEMAFSSAPDVGEPSYQGFVSYDLLRGEDRLFAWSMHSLASMRWIPVPGAEIFVTRDHPIRFDIAPCHTHTTLTVGYNIERDRSKSPIIFNETFKYRAGEILSHELHAIDINYEALIEED